MTVTNYVWDPVTDNVIKETDDVGNVTASYTTEPDQFGNLISQDRNGTKNYYHYDGRGSTLALTDSNGDVTDTYAYNAYGEITDSSGTTTNPYRYNGEKGYQYDEETADYYVRARNYQPKLARFISRDPLSENGQELMTDTGFVHSRLNAMREHPYVYARNDPVNSIDPTGQIADNIILCQIAVNINTVLPKQAFYLPGLGPTAQTRVCAKTTIDCEPCAFIDCYTPVLWCIKQVNITVEVIILLNRNRRITAGIVGHEFFHAEHIKNKLEQQPQKDFFKRVINENTPNDCAIQNCCNTATCDMIGRVISKSTVQHINKWPGHFDDPDFPGTDPPAPFSGRPYEDKAIPIAQRNAQDNRNPNRFCEFPTWGL